MQQSVQRLGRRTLEIPEGNLVLLHDHPEGHYKIQDKYKNGEFLVIGKQQEANVYLIKPVSGKAQCGWSTNTNYQDVKKPRRVKDLLVHNLLKKGFIFLLLIQNYKYPNHPKQL